MTLLTNLEAYYNFDENTGSTVGDTSGHARNGTWQGTLGSQWTTGKINKGGNFNGSDNGVLSTIAPTVLDGSFSVSMWLKFITLPTGTTAAMFDSHVVSYNGYYAQLQAHDFGTVQPRFTIWDGTTQYFTTHNTNLSASTWYHFVCVKDASGKTLSMYINGSLDGAATSYTTFTTPSYSDFNIGRAGDNSLYANIVADEVGVWSRVLSSSEVTQLYNSGNGLQYPFGIYACMPMTLMGI